MRVLIAGGAGFLGSHLVDRLLKRSEISALVVVDNLWTGSLDNLTHITDPRLKISVEDIETFSSPTKFDEIYHLAAPATPLWYMAEPVRTISANVVGAMRSLSLLAPGGMLAYTSTSEVYGDAVVSPQPESYRGAVDCTGPRASYDEAKRCTEALLFEARRTQGVRVKVVRLFNVFGPRTRADDGRAVSNFISQGLRGEPFTLYGDGAQTRSWGYADEIMDALERYFWAEGVDHPGPVNIGSDREISVLEVAREMQRHFPESPIAHLPPVPQDPDSRRPDLTLAMRLLPGWSCATPYEEGIARTIAWFRDRVAQPSVRRLAQS